MRLLVLTLALLALPVAASANIVSNPVFDFLPCNVWHTVRPLQRHLDSPAPTPDAPSTGETVAVCLVFGVPFLCCVGCAVASYRHDRRSRT